MPLKTRVIEFNIGFTPAPKAVIMIITNSRRIYEKAVENMDVMEMTEKEQMQKNVEEFDRLQRFMALVDDKESAVSQL